ncbi:MAG: hypothetical protein FWD77_06230 [Betaproteobacteria bacterium]|nr:hypothetical protein [Betaproteobacteria bacterium]
MKEDVQIFLVLLCTIAAWAWAWRSAVIWLVTCGTNRFAAHLVGAFLGIGAAFGGFCLSGAFLMPGAVDGATIGVGAMGGLVLLIYLGAIHLSKKKEAQGTETMPVAALSKPDIEEAPAPVHASENKSSNESFKARRKEDKRSQDEYLRQKEIKRAARERALGMSFGDFFQERMEEHLIFWIFILFFVAWAYLFLSISMEGTFSRLVLSFFLTLLMGGLLCALVVPGILLVLILLPFAWISILAEAKWRIGNDDPYIPPPVNTNYTNSFEGANYTRTAQETPPQNNGNWLVPLAIGLWIGHKWGKND